MGSIRICDRFLDIFHEKVMVFGVEIDVKTLIFELRPECRPEPAGAPPLGAAPLSVASTEATRRPSVAATEATCTGTGTARDGRCAESLEALPPPPHAHTHPRSLTRAAGGPCSVQHHDIVA